MLRADFTTDKNQMINDKTKWVRGYPTKFIEPTARQDLNNSISSL